MPQVIIKPYSPAWRSLFQHERETILHAFAPLDVAVEHIGSTSVEGLAAKPVIDILLSASSLLVIEQHIKTLAKQGYIYVPKYEAEIPMRRYFVKSPLGSLRVHLHGVQAGSDIERNHLVFRDALRTDAALREEYQTLKLRLAQEFADDKATYTAAKEPFIRSVLANKHIFSSE